ncbi:MAG: hypothetical protein A2Z34_00455 [Planctomycetes bacterium RBG_16_59_8]|nr:MAG: hypothetical protein A2Z34_00455 [Planctomycetes bacterium RBG_16_59_8]
MHFGDYLFANAFTLYAELKSPELISLLARTTKKMCAGELSQTAMRFNLAISEEEYVRMIELKTASLFAASCQIGAMSGGAARDRLAGFGLAVGTAFQIVDDCLDIVGNETSMGKKPGNDVARGKFTLPVIRLLRLLPGEEKKSLSELLLSPDDSGEKRTRVCELVERFGTADYAMEKARSLVQKAKEDIVAGDSRCVATLRALADFAVERSW